MKRENEKVKVILCVGALGSGKDTMADRLVSLGVVEKHGKFAKHLKDVVSSLFFIPRRLMDDRKAKNTSPALAGGKTIGQLLQWFGTELVRAVNPYLWCSTLWRSMQTEINGEWYAYDFAVSDCRFLNEAEYFMEDEAFDTRIIYLTREMQDSRDATHPSETGRFDILEKYGQDPRFMVITNHAMTLGESFHALNVLIENGVL